MRCPGFASLVVNCRMAVIDSLLEHKIIAILRGAQPKDVFPIVQALYEGGIRAVEITLNSPDALRLIREIATAMKDKMLVGAGTVLDANEAAEVIGAGAQFIIAPCVNIDTIRLTKQKGVVSIPGAYTPTEILTAFKAGADIIKLFPASTPQYLREVKAPLSHIPIMPTGGINLDNILAYKNAGAVAFGIGTSLVDTKKEITEEYLEQLAATSKLFVSSVE
jgi:2-dehydro-3-deoxyphosphogluconate aldolase/(4S)-4-hydroxy-2-oxoglutarate aldolase